MMKTLCVCQKMPVGRVWIRRFGGAICADYSLEAAVVEGLRDKPDRATDKSRVAKVRRFSPNDLNSGSIAIYAGSRRYVIGYRKMALSRSEQMARIKGSNTSPELALRKALWARGLRYRLMVRTIGGRPDLVFPKQRLAVFIDGCFWHGCPLHYARPRSRHEFWSIKLAENIHRDYRQSDALHSAGWSVVRLWEHEVILDLARATDRVAQSLKRSNRLWKAQRRVRRVVDLGGGFERREFVALGAPETTVDVADGTRVTAKARVLKSAIGRQRTTTRAVGT